MVEVFGIELEDYHFVAVFLVLLVAGYFGVHFATPGPSFSTDPMSVFGRTQVALGVATVAEPGEGSIRITDRRIESSGGQLFGTFEGGGTDIEPGESVDYCADVYFQSTSDWTYVGTYLSSSDFDFPNEGDTKWSDYYSSGTTHEICNSFTAPGGGSYSIAMYCDFNSPGCDDKVDEDSFSVEGDTDSPPEIRDLNCPSSVNVGETVTIDPDVDDDTGISDYYWDGDDVYSTSSELITSWDTTGTKDVELTVTDQSGQTDFESCSISVEEATVDASDVAGNTVLDFLGSATAAVASLFS